MFSRPLLGRDYMHGPISIENISFLRNCDIKTTKCIFQKINKTLEIEHSQVNSPIDIPHYGFHSRSADLADKPNS